jgi:hypothetical protein
MSCRSASAMYFSATSTGESRARAVCGRSRSESRLGPPGNHASNRCQEDRVAKDQGHLVPPSPGRGPLAGIVKHLEAATSSPASALPATFWACAKVANAMAMKRLVSGFLFVCVFQERVFPTDDARTTAQTKRSSRVTGQPRQIPAGRNGPVKSPLFQTGHGASKINFGGSSKVAT